MSQEEVRRGPIEGTSRVVRELLDTPNFKKSLKILLSELDPENAALLVRTLIWTDAEFFMSLLGATPSLVNAGVVGIRELAEQLAAFPPLLLSGFIAQIVEGIDAESLGEATGRYLAILMWMRDLGDPSLRDAAENFRLGFSRGLRESLSAEGDGEGAAELLLASLLPLVRAHVARLGEEASRGDSETSRLVEGLARGAREIASQNPVFMEKVVMPLVEAWREALASVEREDKAGGQG